MTVARRLPARFDVSARAEFPAVSPSRLARQIRQDMWRALQNVRGFSPVVRVERGDVGLVVTAGGQASKPIAPTLEHRIAEILGDTSRRARWINWASKGQGL